MLTALVTLSALSTLALAGPEHDTMDATLPSRPTTYVVDDRLTASEVENFRDLKVDPKSLAEELSPVAGGAKDDAPASGLATRQGKTRKASLPIINLSSSYADITINGLAVGRIGPLTNGAIHNVTEGLYEVAFRLQNGFEVTKQVKTVTVSKALVPGGEGARVSLEEGWVPLWSDSPEKGWVKHEEPEQPKPQRRVRLVGKRIEFDGKVMFDTGSAVLSESSFGLINEMAAVLAESTLVDLVEVQGHTDSRGSAKVNRTLSQARAEAVVNHLISQGIAAERLSARGYGPDVPVLEGDTEEAWAKNRRVELHVLKQRNPNLLKRIPAGDASDNAPVGPIATPPPATEPAPEKSADE